MRIDMEQFLALTVALGTVGALGAAVYTSRPDVQAALRSLSTDDATDPEASGESSGSPPSEAQAAEPEPAPTMMPVPIPVLAEPTEISPVVPEPEAESIPGPDIETANW